MMTYLSKLSRMVAQVGGEQFNEMPAFGEQLSEHEIRAVLAYIKNFWTEEQRSMQRERTEAVRSQSDD